MSIHIRDLVKVYGSGAGAVTALSGLTLDIPDATVCVLRGPNGSGKTTLIEILTGALHPTAGEVRVSQSNGSRPRISIVRQFDDLAPQLTVREHFELLISGARDWGTAQTLMDRRVVDLTRGERHNVMIALALAAQPDVLLADEPTGALSPEEAEDVYDLLAREARERRITLLLVTHDAHAERIADRVVSLRDGRVSEEWTPGGLPRQVVDDHGWLRVPDEVRTSLQRTVAIEASASGAKVLGRSEAIALPRPPRLPRTVDSDSALEISGLSARRGGRVVFSRVTCSFARGAITVVTGGPGSGKTTFLRSLVGLAEIEDGAVVWATSPRSAMYSDIDLPYAMHLSLNELISGSPSLAQLELLALADRPLRTLSGGQQQRARIALALEHPARVVLLDDPTSGLDGPNAQLALDAIAASSKTWIIATHDRRVLDIADAALLLPVATPVTARGRSL